MADWITVTMPPDGHRIRIATEHIVRVRPALRSEGVHPTSAAAIDLVNGMWQETLESADEIMGRISSLSGRALPVEPLKK